MISYGSMLLITNIVLLIAIILVIQLNLRLKKVENKLIDLSPKDIFPFIEQLREMVFESERIAEQLDMSIKEKEALLEDITVLADTKITALNDLFEKEDGIKDAIKISVADVKKELEKEISERIAKVKHIKSAPLKTEEGKTKFVQKTTNSGHLTEPKQVIKPQSLNDDEGDDDFQGEITPPIEKTSAEEKKISKREKIITMVNEGKSDMVIARELGISTSEVMVAKISMK